MIITQQMEKTMDDEMTKMIFEGLGLLFRFAQDRLAGQHDVAQDRRLNAAGKRRSGRK